MTQNPSELLKALSSSLQTHNYLRLLEHYVYPFLDHLPSGEKEFLVAAIADASNAFEGIRLISFESRSESITKALKALLKHVESNWRGGYETQVCSSRFFITVTWVDLHALFLKFCRAK